MKILSLTTIAHLAAITLTGAIGSKAIATPVTGEIDRWNLWSFDTNTIEAACIAGESPCRESEIPADTFAGASFSVRIPVEGHAKLVDGRVTELTLVQNRQVSIPISDERHGQLTLSALVWNLSHGLLRQAPGAFAQCSTSAPVCRAIAAAIQDPRIDSPLDFDGIPVDFPIQFGALLLTARPAFRAEKGKDGTISIDVASNQPQSHPTSTIFNAATTIHFTLHIAP